jgi:ELWxxDGT repeat protein
MWTSRGSSVYFTAPESGGVALWRSDGTDAGTVRLAAGSVAGRRDCRRSERRCFFARGGGSIVAGGLDPTTLYVIDAGDNFTPVRKFAEHSNSSPTTFVAGHDGVYFAGVTTTEGRELWYSDGTSDGTHLVYDATPGTGDSYFRIVPFRGSVYFNAGSRLRVTPPGTLAADAPGVDSGIGAQYAITGSIGGQSLTVSAGTVLLDEAFWRLHPGIDVVSGAGATVVFTASADLGRLDISGAARVSGDGLVIKLRELALSSPTGWFDLATNDLVIDYAPGSASPIGSWAGSDYTGVLGLVRDARHDGDWTGPGLRAQTPAARSGLTALGVAEAADVLALPPANPQLGTASPSTPPPFS